MPIPTLQKFEEDLANADLPADEELRAIDGYVSFAKNQVEFDEKQAAQLTDSRYKLRRNSLERSFDKEITSVFGEQPDEQSFSSLKNDLLSLLEKDEPLDESLSNLRSIWFEAKRDGIEQHGLRAPGGVVKSGVYAGRTFSGPQGSDLFSVQRKKIPFENNKFNLFIDGVKHDVEFDTDNPSDEDFIQAYAENLGGFEIEQSYLSRLFGGANDETFRVQEAQSFLGRDYFKGYNDPEFLSSLNAFERFAAKSEMVLDKIDGGIGSIRREFFAGSAEGVGNVIRSVGLKDGREDDIFTHIGNTIVDMAGVAKLNSPPAASEALANRQGKYFNYDSVDWYVDKVPGALAQLAAQIGTGNAAGFVMVGTVPQAGNQFRDSIEFHTESGIARGLSEEEAIRQGYGMAVGEALVVSAAIGSLEWLSGKALLGSTVEDIVAKIAREGIAAKGMRFSLRGTIEGLTEMGQEESNIAVEAGFRGQYDEVFGDPLFSGDPDSLKRSRIAEAGALGFLAGGPAKRVAAGTTYMTNVGMNIVNIGHTMINPDRMYAGLNEDQIKLRKVWQQKFNDVTKDWKINNGSLNPSSPKSQGDVRLEGYIPEVQLLDYTDEDGNRRFVVRKSSANEFDEFDFDNVADAKAVQELFATQEELAQRLHGGQLKGEEAAGAVQALEQINVALDNLRASQYAPDPTVDRSVGSYPTFVQALGEARRLEQQIKLGRQSTDSPKLAEELLGLLELTEPGDTEIARIKELRSALGQDLTGLVSRIRAPKSINLTKPLQTPEARKELEELKQISNPNKKQKDRLAKLTNEFEGTLRPEGRKIPKRKGAPKKAEAEIQALRQLVGEGEGFASEAAEGVIADAEAKLGAEGQAIPSSEPFNIVPTVKNGRKRYEIIFRQPVAGGAQLEGTGPFQTELPAKRPSTAERAAEVIQASRESTQEEVQRRVEEIADQLNARERGREVANSVELESQIREEAQKMAEKLAEDPVEFEAQLEESMGKLAPQLTEAPENISPFLPAAAQEILTNEELLADQIEKTLEKSGLQGTTAPLELRRTEATREAESKVAVKEAETEGVILPKAPPIPRPLEPVSSSKFSLDNMIARSEARLESDKRKLKAQQESNLPDNLKSKFREMDLKRIASEEEFLEKLKRDKEADEKGLTPPLRRKLSDAGFVDIEAISQGVADAYNFAKGKVEAFGERLRQLFGESISPFITELWEGARTAVGDYLTAVIVNSTPARVQDLGVPVRSGTRALESGAEGAQSTDNSVNQNANRNIPPNKSKVFHASEADFSDFAVKEIGFHFGQDPTISENAARLGGARDPSVKEFSISESANIVEIDGRRNGFRPDDVLSSLLDKGVISQDQFNEAQNAADDVEEDLEAKEDEAREELEPIIGFGISPEILFAHAQANALEPFFKSWGIDGFVYWNTFDAGGMSTAFGLTDAEIASGGISPNWSYIITNKSVIQKPQTQERPGPSLGGARAIGREGGRPLKVRIDEANEREQKQIRRRDFIQSTAVALGGTALLGGILGPLINSQIKTSRRDALRAAKRDALRAGVDVESIPETATAEDIEAATEAVNRLEDVTLSDEAVDEIIRLSSNARTNKVSGNISQSPFATRVGNRSYSTEEIDRLFEDRQTITTNVIKPDGGKKTISRGDAETAANELDEAQTTLANNANEIELELNKILNIASEIIGFDIPFNFNSLKLDTSLESELLSQALDSKGGGTTPGGEIKLKAVTQLTDLISNNPEKKAVAAATISHELIHLAQLQKGSKFPTVGIKPQRNVPPPVLNALSKQLSRIYGRLGFNNNEGEAFTAAYLSTKAYLHQSGLPMQLRTNVNELRNVGEAGGETFATTNLYSGLPLETVQLVAADLFNTVNTFSEWSQGMISRLGERIKPYLRELWAELKAGAGKITEDILRKVGGIQFAVDPSEGRPISSFPSRQSTEPVSSIVGRVEIPPETQKALARLRGEEIVEHERSETDKEVTPEVLAAVYRGEITGTDAEVIRKLRSEFRDSYTLIEKGIGPLNTLNTEFRKIHPMIETTVRKLDRDITKRINDWNAAAEPFSKVLKKVRKTSKDTYDDLFVALRNGDVDSVRGILADYSNGLTAYQQFNEGVLDDMFNQYRQVGRLDMSDRIVGYFPSAVSQKNRAAYHEWMAKGPLANEIQSEIRKRERRNNGESLTIWQKEIVANQVIAGTIRAGRALPTAVKKRKIEKITKEAAKFYDDPIDTINRTIQQAARDIETRKFFGRRRKDYAKDVSPERVNELEERFEKAFNESSSQTGKVAEEAIENLLDEFRVGNSIGGVVETLRRRGLIDQADINKLKELLRIRFNYVPNGTIVSTTRDLGYMAVLANPIAAITQLEGLAWSGHSHGYLNTATSLARRAARKDKIPLDDLSGAIRRSFDIELRTNWVKILAEGGGKEFFGGKLKAWPGMYRIGTFDFGDRLDKSLVVNSYFEKIQKMSDSDLRNELRNIEHTFHDSVDQVIQDIRDENITDDVHWVAENRLGQMHPIYLSDMPIGYLQHPNTRLLFQLKVFSLRRNDFARAQFINQMQDGGRGIKSQITGYKKLLGLALIWGAAGAPTDEIKQFMQGNDVRFSENVVNNFLKLIFLNKWSLRRFSQKPDLYQAFFDIARFPMAGVAEDGFRLVGDLWDLLGKGDTTALDAIRSTRLTGNIPVVGRLYSSNYGATGIPEIDVTAPDFLDDPVEHLKRTWGRKGKQIDNYIDSQADMIFGDYSDDADNQINTIKRNRSRGQSTERENQIYTKLNALKQIETVIRKEAKKAYTLTGDVQATDMILHMAKQAHEDPTYFRALRQKIKDNSGKFSMIPATQSAYKQQEQKRKLGYFNEDGSAK